MFKYISEEIQKEFINKYPGAYYYLLAEELKGEKAALKDELNIIKPNTPRAVWIKERLKDLKEIS